MTQLENIISNLKEKPEVDAVFITGSYGAGDEKSYSDIDLGIVLNTEPSLQGLFQWVDDRPCDIYFFDASILNLILLGDRISPNDREGLIVNFLEKADIKFDKTGELTSYKNDLEKIKGKVAVPENKKLWFEGVINSAYVTNKRYFDSSVSDYKEALEIKLAGDINLLLKGYFEFRNIPWKGENEVVRYLSENDPNFYDLYMRCLRSFDINEKFRLYSDLVDLTLNGDFKKWTTDTVQPFASNMNVQKKIELIEYWKRLIS